MTVQEFREQYEAKNGKPKIPDFVKRNIEKHGTSKVEIEPKKVRKPRDIKVFEYAIGVDGSFRKDGLAVAIINLETKEVKTCTLKNLRSFQMWFDDVNGDFLDKLPKSAAVFYEDTGRSEIVIDSIFNSFCARTNMPNNRAMRDKYAISVGKNIAATNYVRDLFIEKYKRENVNGVTPKEKGKKLDVGQMKIFHNIFLPDDVTQDELDATAVAKVGYEMFRLGHFRK